MATEIKKKEEIIRALLEILDTYSLEEMSVTLLTKYLAISRATLYRIFETKEILLKYLEDTVLKDFIAVYDFDKKDLGQEYFANNFCKHILKYRNYYKWQLENPRFIEALSLQLKNILYNLYKNDDYAIFASYGTIGYIVHWVRSGFEKSPIEVVEGLRTIGQEDWRNYHSGF